MSCNEQNCATRENSTRTSTTYMNKSWSDMGNSRVPALLIGLSERSLSKGNRKLMTVIAIILIRYIIFEIALIKVSASEKERKERKTVEPKDGDAHQIAGGLSK